MEASQKEHIHCDVMLLEQKCCSYAIHSMALEANVENHDSSKNLLFCMFRGEKLAQLLKYYGERQTNLLKSELAGAKSDTVSTAHSDISDAENNDLYHLQRC